MLPYKTLNPPVGWLVSKFPLQTLKLNTKLSLYGDFMTSEIIIRYN